MQLYPSAVCYASTNSIYQKLKCQHHSGLARTSGRVETWRLVFRAVRADMQHAEWAVNMRNPLTWQFYLRRTHSDYEIHIDTIYNGMISNSVIKQSWSIHLRAPHRSAGSEGQLKHHHSIHSLRVAMLSVHAQTEHALEEWVLMSVLLVIYSCLDFVIFI